MKFKKNPFNSGYYQSQQLKTFGFKRVGKNVEIAKNCTIVGLENISLGNNIRIDSNVIIAANTGYLKLGNHIHIGAGSYLGCGGGINFSDFSGLSQNVHIYSASEDYSGKSMTNPTVLKKYRKIKSSPVFLKKHAIIGSGSVILPGVTIGTGASVGALSFIHISLDSWSVYFGVPAQKVNKRFNKLVQLEKKLAKETK
jgi:acetyltransferase-like isoleucine patch superfamily enzyme